MSQRSNTIKAAGLYTFLSELQAPEGSQVVAKNVNIDELGVLSSRRGFNDYGAELAESTYRIKQILNYKKRILRYFNDTLEFDDGSGNFSAFSGVFNEVEAGFRIKAEEVNGNLYFTTSDGIKKISASSASDFTTSSNFIVDAGAPKGIDLSAKTIPATSGFLPPQSKVAYKVLFGYRDANNVLILGAPTSRFVVTNNSQNVNVPEQTNVTILNDENGSTYEGKYFLVPALNRDFYVWYSEIGAGTLEPQDNVTIGKTGIEIPILNNETALDIARKTANILFQELSDYYTVSVSSNTIKFISKEEGDIDNITIGTIAPANLTTNVIQQGDVAEGTNANCEISTIIPDGVTTNYFIQVYRTSVITVTEGLDINDIDPGEDCNLVYEEPITQPAGTTIAITDLQPNSFRDTGVPLYNNPISGQGILQANEVPPIAKDIENFNNFTFYSNTQTFHRNQITFLSVDDFGDQETSIVIGNEDIAREYVFQGAQEDDRPCSFYKILAREK